MALPTSVDYTGPARHLGKASDMSLPQQGPFRKLSVEGGMNGSPKTGTGKNTMAPFASEDYRGPGYMECKKYGDASNQPKKSSY